MSEGVGTGPGRGSGDRLAMASLLAGAGALAAAGPRLRRRLTPALGPTLADLVSTTSLTFAGWLMVAVVERRRPYRREWQTALDHETAVDVAFAVVLAPPASLVAGVVSDRFDTARSAAGRRSAAAAWPGGLPLPVRVACAVGVTELVHYWHHRLSHERAWLWRFHAVHHTPTRLNWLNSGRFHPVDFVPLVTLQLIVVRLLGVDEDTFTAMQIFKGIHGQIQHSNVAGRAGALNRVFSTAEQHRWHHAAAGDGAACNYGAVLSTFDRIFGTKVLPGDREVGELGLGGGPVPTPVNFLEHLTGPWRTTPARSAAGERPGQTEVDRSGDGALVAAEGSCAAAPVGSCA